MKIITINDLKKHARRYEVSNMYGSNTIEYHFEGIGARICKEGNAICLDRSKPYVAQIGREHERFKTYKEALSYVYENCMHDILQLN